MFGGRPAAVSRRLTAVAAIALGALCLPGFALPHALRDAATPAAGFSQPYAGTPKYQRYAPTEATSARQINRPIGSKAADRIARKLGLDKAHAFTAQQYALFISGKGVGGNKKDAELVDASVRIFTNTTGKPLYANVDGKATPTVLSSYGLFVNKGGKLMSLANTGAPTRKVNVVLAPGGYLGEWCRKNGAQDSLRMLYQSAYTSEVVYGNKSQQQSGVDQLVLNQKGPRRSTVGMSMVPSIWIVNFVAVYTLNPKLAAYMPARWTPIPDNVVQAIQASPNGQVPYSEYQASFKG
jgi:hypothetical protein